MGSAELLRKGPEERAWPSLRRRRRGAGAAARGDPRGSRTGGRHRLVAPDARQELERQIQADRLNAQRRLAAGSKTATRAQTAPPSEEARAEAARAELGARRFLPKRPRDTPSRRRRGRPRESRESRESRRRRRRAAVPVAAAGVAPSSGRVRASSSRRRNRGPEPEANSARDDRGASSSGKKRLVAHRRARDFSPPRSPPRLPRKLSSSAGRTSSRSNSSRWITRGLTSRGSKGNSACRRRAAGRAAPRRSGSRRPDRRGGRGDRSVFERSMLPRGDATSRGRRYE